jgi:flagella basal body P-ring formation protein FlgA
MIYRALILSSVVLGHVSLGLAFSEAALAAPLSNERTEIRLQGRSEAIVTEPVIRLGDVALIESAAVSDDEAIIELRKIALGDSPKAGDTATLEGVSILDKLRDAGVRLDSVLYTFPKQVRVTRAYREVSQDELERALKSFLTLQERKIDVRHLIADKPVRVPADSLSIEVVNLQSTRPGHFGVDYRSRAAGGSEVRFQMKALADEWRMMPTAVKPIKRGDVVTASDLRLTKVNGTAVSSDSLEELGDIVGRVALRDVGQGEIFNAKAVKIPPVVDQGSRVTMVFKRGRLEATARGVALEDGLEGQEINVRNEASKKVVRARVKERGLVSVGGVQ